MKGLHFTLPTITKRNLKEKDKLTTVSLYKCTSMKVTYQRGSYIHVSKEGKSSNHF